MTANVERNKEDSNKEESNRQKIADLRGKLIVSCQASAGEPLCSPHHILALSLSVLNGGAAALRLEGVDNVALVRQHVSVPIVALTKAGIPENERLSSVYITPTFEDAQLLAEAGADIIAVDATQRQRPGGITLVELVRRIKLELGKPVWADVATMGEGLAALACGVDIISTTLSGYTSETANRPDRPDYDLLKELCRVTDIPVILEGRVWTTEQVSKAFGDGAYAVVVGSAITRPQLITRRFVAAIPAVS